ncbi:MAG: hypothetical protein H6587_02440 [Flavobacteriales bacterium]|nr:hypothetical protein [Flavobacteriales bacterium]
METKSKPSLIKSFEKGQGKDKQLIKQFIQRQVEKGTGQSILQLKENHSEQHLFYIALKHITTTKKALCKALDINIDNACRYKRELELNGNLVQSIDEIVCPYTGFMAHLISTNPKEFQRLQKSNTNQTKLSL